MRHPFIVMEGRSPLPNQTVTRQTYVPEALRERGIQTTYIDAESPLTYDTQGRIRQHTPYGAVAPQRTTLEPGSYAWRLRDPAWTNGDPPAYREDHGYNSQRARTELATRQGLAEVLCDAGLHAAGIPTMRASATKSWKPGERVFIKPDTVDDISELPSRRARLVHADETGHITLEQDDKDMVVQSRVTTVAVRTLVDHLGIVSPALEANTSYLHALRIFTPLWLPHSATPAVELRITDARTDLGKRSATHRHLLEPEHAFRRLSALAGLHRVVHDTLALRYGPENYLTLDYIILPDGSAKIVNGLVRGLTPNLEHQPPEVQHLANATADVEVRHLAELALRRAA